MKQKAVAIIATMVLLTSNNQTGKLYGYGNKKVATTAAVRDHRMVLKNGDKSIQKDCIETEELLHECMFIRF